MVTSIFMEGVVTETRLMLNKRDVKVVLESEVKYTKYSVRDILRILD